MPSTVAFNIVANQDETKLFAATENGPYVYIKEKEKWYSLIGKNTPIQTYWSVEYLNDSKTARFGTYGRGVWDFKELELPLSTEKNELVQLDIFPNPVNDILNLNANMKEWTYNIVNLSGKRLISGQDSKSINVSDLKQGVYFINFRKGKNQLTKKFVKL
jgi:hypothetical protein